MTWQGGLLLTASYVAMWVARLTWRHVIEVRSPVRMLLMPLPACILLLSAVSTNLSVRQWPVFSVRVVHAVRKAQADGASQHRQSR